MARLLIGAAFGVLIGVTVGAALGLHAQEDEQVQDALSARVDCIIQRESGGDPGAYNARSGAAGLGQFLYSTWLTTPQGQAGYSRYNAAANRAAVGYMLEAGRAREFVAVSAGLC